MPKVVQHRDKCIGCGVCFELQPELWRMSRKDGKATMLRAEAKKNVYIAEVDDHTYERTKEIAPLCPVRIIKV